MDLHCFRLESESRLIYLLEHVEYGDTASLEGRFMGMTGEQAEKDWPTRDRGDLPGFSHATVSYYRNLIRGTHLEREDAYRQVALPRNDSEATFAMVTHYKELLANRGSELEFLQPGTDEKKWWEPGNAQTGAGKTME